MAKKRPGKYAHIIDTLPKLDNVEPQRRDMLEQVKKDILRDPSQDDLSAVGSHSTEDDVETILDSVSALVRRVLYKKMLRTTAGRPWASEFGRAYADLRFITSRLDDLQSELGVLLEAYQELMIDQFDVEGVSALKLANGQPVRVQYEPFAQVEDRDKFRTWCIKNGLERSLQLPWPTTNKLTKEMLLAGDPEPDGVTCYSRSKIVLSDRGE